MNLFEQSIAEVKISYSHKVKPSLQKQIKCSQDAYDIVYPLCPDIDYKEHFAIVLLSRSNKVLGLSWISEGGVSGTVVDVKIVMQTLLKSNSSAFLCVHNHPSGNRTYSNEDKKITIKLKEAAKLLDIQLLDHIVITSEGYSSMGDDGIL